MNIKTPLRPGFPSAFQTRSRRISPASRNPDRAPPLHAGRGPANSRLGAWLLLHVWICRDFVFQFLWAVSGS